MPKDMKNIALIATASLRNALKAYNHVSVAFVVKTMINALSYERFLSSTCQSLRTSNNSLVIVDAAHLQSKVT